jgi:DNA repair protein RecN (Recombination protein N)
VLRRLTVKNLAIVEDLEMEFEGGLTVITGETGAGKSILVDALSLLAGGRGSVDLVREGAPRLTVSGEFDADPSVRKILSEAGLPDTGTLLLRREFSPDGKGRVFVEDEAASVRTLGRIGERLVAIHGQNSERDLADRETPLELLDDHAGALEEGRETAAAAEAWSSARRALEELEASRRDRDARLEMLDYQIREIREAAPDEKELADLTIERDRLLHADRIRSAAQAALSALSEDEGSAADRLGEAGRAFAQLAAIDPREAARVEEVEDLKRRVADLAAMARDAAGSIEADPDRLTGIESRLEQLARIQRKYGGTLADVLALAEKLARERDELSDIEDSLERRRREERGASSAYLEAAGRLSAKRAFSAPKFSAAVERELHALAMEKARFEVRLDRLSEDAPRASGLETAAFLFAPNPGEAAKPVEKIASGGELSRLHLAIQSVAAGKKGARRTLVFDEVDSGIGGRTAEVVGRKLKTLAARGQVLCVTHVPQIAAVADRHYLAEKREARGRTIAAVRQVEGKERVAEIARMLAGETIPETAVRHARTLLEAGQG